MNILELKERKKAGQKLTMLTCYDSWSAKILNETPVDILLVGDSAAMVMHGHQDTIPATLEMMEWHVAAVRKGAPKKFIVGDMPFLSFRKSVDENLEAVGRLLRAGAQAVKLEGFDGNGEFIRHAVQSGVPVMGHIGLTPQFVNAFGGFRVQGRNEEARKKIMSEARGLEEAGAFAVVLECIPADLAAEITSTLKIPTIGIGAGERCDGQVLVLHDMLGFSGAFKPKFVRQYVDGSELIHAAVDRYCADVTGGRFPGPEESYS
jgi:3-methyl-2-oxobutanoate hydroxymethyltransferase